MPPIAQSTTAMQALPVYESSYVPVERANKNFESVTLSNKKRVQKELKAQYLEQMKQAQDM